MTTKEGLGLVAGIMPLVLSLYVILKYKAATKAEPRELPDTPTPNDRVFQKFLKKHGGADMDRMG